jgi:hypothetical protein
MPGQCIEGKGDLIAPRARRDYSLPSMGQAPLLRRRWGSRKGSFPHIKHQDNFLAAWSRRTTHAAVASSLPQERQKRCIRLQIVLVSTLLSMPCANSKSGEPRAMKVVSRLQKKGVRKCSRQM